MLRIFDAISNVTLELQVIARGTPGFSGADLANLVNIAALKAARDNAAAVTQVHLRLFVLHLP